MRNCGLPKGFTQKWSEIYNDEDDEGASEA